MPRSGPEILYTADSELRRFPHLVCSMFADLRASQYLAWRLFVRNFSAQYRQTALGYLWLILPPIVTTLTWMFLNNQKILNVGKTELPYPVYVLTGTLLWQLFVDTINSPIELFRSSKPLLAKLHFPHEALVIAALAGVLFNFAVRVMLLFGVLFYFRVPLSTHMLLAPFGLSALVSLGLVVGLILLPAALLYGDVQRVLSTITSIWFFLTPVVYPPPTGWPAALLSKLNPATPLIVASREWLTGRTPEDTGPFLIVISTSVALILMAWFAYRVARPHLIERMGS